MKTRRMTRVSFSAKTKVLDVSLPKAWSDLSQKELLDVYRMRALVYADGKDMLFPLFRYFGNIRVLDRDGDTFLCRFLARDSETGKRARVMCRVTPVQLDELLEPLRFVYDPGAVPVRLDVWHGAAAVNAQLHGVSFGNYLKIENLYQGFIASHNSDALLSIAKILYPGIKEKHVDDVFVFGLLQWLVQVKALFARMWPNFFKPATGAVSAPSMLDVMNNEIRALTGGDVTKEEVVFETECWRALTELDFKAKEAEDMKRKMNNSKL